METKKNSGSTIKSRKKSEYAETNKHDSTTLQDRSGIKVSIWLEPYPAFFASSYHAPEQYTMGSSP